MEKSEINVGLLGWGTVGTGVSRILVNQKHRIYQNTGLNLNLLRIAKRTLPAYRSGIDLAENCLTTDVNAIVDNPDIEIVVELIGGTTDSLELISRAMQNGKSIVTANKALIAECGADLCQLAQKQEVSLKFEASTAGGIPIIKTLRESFAGDKVESIYGIVNGTCNYILTEMQKNGRDFSEALEMAQDKGYAEEDPTLDIEGIDAAQKLTILTALAHHISVPLNQVHTEGITKITQNDIQYAQELGYAIKLLAITKLRETQIDVRVHPTLIPNNSMLANVSDAFNAVCVIGDAVGPTLFYGQGAGEMPTASAVVADIIDAARSITGNSHLSIPPAWVSKPRSDFSIGSIDDIETRYYLRLVVRDCPGVLAQIGTILGNRDISIASVIQKEPHCKDSVPLVILTHKACEANMYLARIEIDNLEVVQEKLTLIRIEEFDF